MSSTEETTASGRPKRRAAQQPPVGIDIEGRDAATGSCHCCGGMLRRHPESAKQCGKCGARYHTYDCGNRRSQAGFTNFDQCPRVGVLPSSILRASTRPGPVFYAPRPAKVCRTFSTRTFRGLFTWIAFSTLLASSLTDALLRSDSAPKFACAQEGRWSATPEPFATPAG